MQTSPLKGQRTFHLPFAPAVCPSEAAGLGGRALPMTPRPEEVLPTGAPEDPLLLVQMRYEEYVAMRELQLLFENGEFACLGW